MKKRIPLNIPNATQIKTDLDVIAGTTPVTMTSLELVELINSQRKKGEAVLRHDSFMAKVPKVLGEAAPKFFGTAFYTNGTGAKVERKVYRFPKREACLMAMSYSYELQAKVFDRMTALEESVAKPVLDPAAILESPAAMRSILLTYTEKVIALEKTVEEQIPAVQFQKTVADSEGWQTLAEIAKSLGTGTKRLMAFLRNEGVLARNNTPYQRLVDSGRFKLIQKVDKNNQLHPVIVVSGKGVIFIEKLIRDVAKRLLAETEIQPEFSDQRTPRPAESNVEKISDDAKELFEWIRGQCIRNKDKGVVFSTIYLRGPVKLRRKAILEPLVEELIESKKISVQIMPGRKGKVIHSITA